jgi:class 3 adenylate cyclase
MSERLNKTSICSVIFLDIVGYSQKPVSAQIEDKNRFNQLIGDAIKNIAQNDRIILDTGDGAAIALLGAPEEALFAALTIRDGILLSNQDSPDSPLQVRIGINLGPVRVVKDINNHLNIIGDGINVAQRVMSFADANQILVSRSYYEVVSRLTTEFTNMFSYSGVKQDKHVREHEVYMIQPHQDEPHAAAAEQAMAMPGSAPRLMAAPGKKTAAIIAATAVCVVVLAALLLPRKPQLTVEGQPQNSSQDAGPTAGKARAIPISTSEIQQAAPQPAPKKQAEPKPERQAKAAVASTADSEKPAKPKAKKTAAKKTAENTESAAPKQEPAPQQQEKSGWQKFTESVKQGAEKPACSDAQRMLGQCS